MVKYPAWHSHQASEVFGNIKVYSAQQIYCARGHKRTSPNYCRLCSLAKLPAWNPTRRGVHNVAAVIFVNRTLQWNEYLMFMSHPGCTLQHVCEKLHFPSKAAGFMSFSPRKITTFSSKSGSCMCCSRTVAGCNMLSWCLKEINTQSGLRGGNKGENWSFFPWRECHTSRFTKTRQKITNNTF